MSEHSDDTENIQNELLDNYLSHYSPSVSISVSKLLVFTVFKVKNQGRQKKDKHGCLHF